jgi:hypothetical protein
MRNHLDWVNDASLSRRYDSFNLAVDHPDLAGLSPENRNHGQVQVEHDGRRTEAGIGEYRLDQHGTEGDCQAKCVAFIR